MNLPLGKTIPLPLTGCSECSLLALNKSSYFPYNYWGNTEAPKFIFVGTAPGREEEISKQVFYGLSGNILREGLVQAGIDPAECFFCNIVACRPKVIKLNRKGEQYWDTRKPNSKEIKWCRDNLDAILTYLKEKNPQAIIVPLGGEALKWFTGNSGITTRHGLINETEYGMVIASYHPTYLDRNPDLMSEFVTDLRFIKERYQFQDQGVEPEYRHQYQILFSFPLVIPVLQHILQNVFLLSFDIETTGLHFWEDTIIGISFAWERNQGVYIPLYVRDEDGSILLKGKRFRAVFSPEQLQEILSLIRSILTDPQKTKIAHHLKFEWKMIKQLWGFELVYPLEDTMLLSFLLNENRRHSLDALTARYPDLRGYKNKVYERLNDEEIDEEVHADLPLDILGEYGCQDADGTLRLYLDFKQELQASGQTGVILSALYERYYKAMSQLYGECEINGLEWDPIFQQQYYAYLEQRSQELQQEIAKLTDVPDFNPRSPLQVADLLYNQYGYPVTKLTDTGNPSADKDTLKLLDTIVPDDDRRKVLSLIGRYKEAKHSQSSFLHLENKMQAYSDQQMAHYSFSLTKVTGRISASKYPIHQVPRPSPANIASWARCMFIARDPYILVHPDYSQIEMRIMAWYAQDREMLREYNEGVDLHAAAAAAIFQIPIEQVTKDQRAIAKSLNFAGLYGAGAPTIQRTVNSQLDFGQTRIPLSLAQKHKDFFFSKYFGIQAWINQVEQELIQNKQVISCFGRIRRLPGVDSQTEDNRLKALRQGPNSIVQGTASDVNQITFVRVWNKLRKNRMDVKPLFTVHDSQFYRVHKACFLEFQELLIEEMTRPVDPITVPLKVDVEAGVRWEEIPDFLREAGVTGMPLPAWYMPKAA